MGNALSGNATRNRRMRRSVLPDEDESISSEDSKSTRRSRSGLENEEVRHVMGRVDPGCSTTIMNWDTYQELHALGAMEVVPLRPSQSTYKFANGVQSKADGRIEILTCVGDEPAQIAANVFKDPGTYFLLGLNFLRENRATITYDLDGDMITCDKLGFHNQVMETDNTGVDCLFFGGEPTEKELHEARHVYRNRRPPQNPKFHKFQNGMLAVPKPSVPKNRQEIGLSACNDDDEEDEFYVAPKPQKKGGKFVAFELEDSSDEEEAAPGTPSPRKTNRMNNKRRCLPGMI